MDIRNLIWKLLKEELDQNTINLKNKYVGEGKPISEDDFNKIIEVSGNKFYLLSWLTKKVGMGDIKSEDIYKYKEYFDIFEKNKRKFKHKDIHLYRTSQDVQDFISEVIAIREGDIVFDETRGKDNYVSQNDIEKLEASDGIKYLGMYDNVDYQYQVFQVSKPKEEVWKIYRDILGRCKGRDQGAKIEICTIGDYNYFKRYLKQPKGSNYFVLFNLDDKDSPYQLHYESGQFMDKNDNSNHNIKQLRFFKFIGDKIKKYSLDKKSFFQGFEVPVPNKGYEDEWGKKQGIWREYHENGKICGEYTYEDDERNGPFVLYYDNGRIDTIANETRNGNYYGKYEEYYDDGTLFKKGVYDDGFKIGFWEFGGSEGFKQIADYSLKPIPMTGVTKNGLVRYTSIKRVGYTNFSPLFGKTTFFFPNGMVQAVGNEGVNYKLGEWVYFNSKGKIISKGKYLKGKRSGEWMDILKTKKGKTYKFVGLFHLGVPVGNISLYDKKNNYIKSIKPSKISPYWKKTISEEDFGYN